jgi:hypothetical protein
MLIILFCMAFVVLINLPMVFNSYHNRRYAEAKLEIAKCVTEMEMLMLNGELKLGDVCHDRIYQNMLCSQYAKRYGTPWKFWKPQPQIKEIRERLHAEMSQKTPLAKLLTRYGAANYKAFRNNRPAASFCFLLWVLIFAGGFLILILSLLSAIKITRSAVKIGSGFSKFKQRAAEAYVAFSAHSPQAV